MRYKNYRLISHFYPANSDKPSEVEGFPQREWWIEVYLVNDKGDLVPANLFDKVVYHLHPSFGPRATQSKSPWSRTLCGGNHRLAAPTGCLSLSGRAMANCNRDFQLSRTPRSVFKKKDGVNLTCRLNWWPTSRISSTMT